MKFTPLDVRHQAFPTRFGGYDKNSVRDFLAELSEDMEQLLQIQEEQRQYLNTLERDLDERKRSEDEIRRTVLAAERIGQDMRENAARESDLLVAQANTHREGILREAEARSHELEARHQARVSALEAIFRNRFAELERIHHQLVLERDRLQAARLAELEQAFTQRHTELTARLLSARQEYAQFLGGYRALMSSFNEMSSRHLLPQDIELPHASLPSQNLPAVPQPPAPNAVPLPPEAPRPQAPTGTIGAADLALDDPAEENPRLEDQQFL